MQPGSALGRIRRMNNMNILRFGAAAAVATLAFPAPATSAATGEQPRTQRATTTITFEVPDCDGCTLQLENGRWTEDDDVRVWSSREKEVQDGTVRFTIPTRKTQGLSIRVHAPWEGHTGYDATVVMRYAKTQPGHVVTFNEAQHKHKASACWAGTDAASLTFPITVKKVRVDGVHERVNGSIAYADTTQEWLDPMRAAWDGVLGSQDVNICGEH